MTCPAASSSASRDPFLTFRTPGSPEGVPVEFDDTRVEVSSDMVFGSPGGVTAVGGAEVCNDSDGSAYSAGFSMTGVPGVTEWGAGPRAGVGDYWAALFVSPSGSVTPQIGIGAVSFTPERGVCAGFWCLGAGGPGLLPPPAIFLMAGVPTAPPPPPF